MSPRPAAGPRGAPWRGRATPPCARSPADAAAGRRGHPVESVPCFVTEGACATARGSNLGPESIG